MNSTTWHSRRHWLAVVAAAALLTGCAQEAPVGPGRLASRSTIDAPTETDSGSADRLAEMSACDSIEVPAGNTIAFQAYANGDQIYRWTGTSWSFVAPDADLYADAEEQGVVGTHYAGPTWQSVSGGKVVGAVMGRCPAGAGNIPWLLLRATPDDGPGVFQRTTYIQRVNTVGGVAPAAAGSVVGEWKRVPYTAVYLFYRAD